MLLELHYLPPIEYLSLILNSPEPIQFEVYEHYIKQTYRNRTTILSANGPLDLIIPIKHSHGNKQLMKDVKINYEENWLKVHLGTFQAAYAKSAYFDFFYPELLEIFNKKNNYLVDLNTELLLVLSKFLGYNFEFNFTENFNQDYSQKYYNFIHPKKKIDWTNGLLKEYQYFQCFGNQFYPNLSSIDLIMNQGRDSLKLLKNT